MKSLSESIADFYIKKNIICSDEKDVYVYGISLLINDILDFALILLVAVIWHHFVYGIVFLLTFCLTRIHCGGFHAKKSWICAVTMLLTFIAICLGTELTNMYYDLVWSIVICSVSIIVLLLVIPIENPNKKLSQEVKSKNKKIGMIIIIIFSMLSLVLTMYSIQEGTIISFTILSVAVLAVMGKILNEGGVKNEKDG